MNIGSSLPPETRFGQYRIVRLLGRGGMGEVYKAEHTTLERRYALKLRVWITLHAFILLLSSAGRAFEVVVA